MFALAVNTIVDLLPQGASQCFPFYVYNEDGSNRRENITDWALELFRAHYKDKTISKWDIFYYVYGILHHPGYREKFADNLKRELPRIPLAGNRSTAFQAVDDKTRHGQDARATDEQPHGQDARATRSTAFQAVNDKQLHGQDARATRSTAFQAVNDKQLHGQDARATSPVSDLHIRQGAHLPHWTRDQATYSVTFRLADCLPGPVLEQWKAERDALTKKAAAQQRPLSAEQAKRLDELHSERVGRYLDAGHGECVLKDARVARVIKEALVHFDGQRYDLLAWCIMPNHVHVVVRPREGNELPGILHSWKSFASNQINKLLHRKGQLWQTEYYDHLIRDEDDFRRALEYVMNNPVSVGLDNWEWVGCSTAFQAVNDEQPHGQDARATGSTAFQAVNDERPHGQDARATKADANAFWAFASAGKKLAELHLNYEKLEPYKLKWLESKGVPLSYRVEKMRLNKEKTAVAVNDSLTLAGIPPETFHYRLGNRSALDWVIDQYQVSEDKRSGIKSDPNRPDDEQYIVRLVGQVVKVSVETAAIVSNLPKNYGSGV